MRDPVEQDRQRWKELGWAEPDAMAGFTAILRAHKVLVDRVHEVVQAFDLSITEHAALLFLAMTEDHSQPLNRVAKQLLIGQGRCNYIVNKLEEQGLLRREPHPSDGRTTLAVLTDAGYKTIQQTIAKLAEIRYGFGATPDAHLTDLRQLLAAVTSDVQPLDE